MSTNFCLGFSPRYLLVTLKVVEIQLVLEQLNTYMQNKYINESRHRLLSFTEICSKWITDLNVNSKTIKLLEDDIVKNIQDIGMAKTFWIQHDSYN